MSTQHLQTFQEALFYCGLSLTFLYWYCQHTGGQSVDQSGLTTKTILDD